MGYPFTRARHGWLLVHVSQPSLDQRHTKAFLRPSRPVEQRTLNLYLAGDFELEVGDFKQVMHAGQSSLDVQMPEYPAGVLVIERPLTEGAARMCMEAAGGVDWTRERRELSAGESLDAGPGGLVVPVAAGEPIGQSYTAPRDLAVFVVRLA